MKWKRNFGRGRVSMAKKVIAIGTRASGRVHQFRTLGCALDAAGVKVSNVTGYPGQNGKTKVKS